MRQAGWLTLGVFAVGCATNPRIAPKPALLPRDLGAFTAPTGGDDLACTLPRGPAIMFSVERR